MKVILSGIKPTASSTHIGNYFGAIKQFVDLQKPENENLYFLANYHALTTVKSKKELEDNTWAMLREYIAYGLDPKESTIFLQSDVPEVTELAWILNCLAPMGLLERAHAYKDAMAKGKEANVGLFDYPVLMAADILIYQSIHVPVGKDQKQHVEIARDLAEKFNHHFGETFVLPEPLIMKETATVPGIDGDKMSKSYNNFVGAFEDEKEMGKKIMSIKTDSLGVDEAKDPEQSIIVQLLRLVGKPDVIKTVEEKFRKGGMGYGDAKKILLAETLEYFAPMRNRYETVSQKELESVVADGAKKARKIAQETMHEVRRKVGLV
ncbi:MAG: tryptophan--tRNA ligase [Candidatus Abawacabacteria bacterium RBG_16_42_10]|uniref:Tryptophan--tRNA ligase n=1 Tax=Candidatus Abawacabacteria bacterium RBG_16_42_10 TaxID=1817814 RepID=A0A1F4XIG6_9BACT|nr:MAG: tryptophan--tRNA ligase [Candidatus Abawacabacteria bacterium RBG_16_42_10]